MGLRNGNMVTVSKAGPAVCPGRTMEGTEGPGFRFCLYLLEEEALLQPVPSSREGRTSAGRVPRKGELVDWARTDLFLSKVDTLMTGWWLGSGPQRL